jgi:DNA-binding NarL/FixJ family response regulator
VILERTVKNHLKNILAQTCSRTRQEAADYSLPRDWIRTIDLAA